MKNTKTYYVNLTSSEGELLVRIPVSIEQGGSAYAYRIDRHLGGIAFVSQVREFIAIHRARSLRRAGLQLCADCGAEGELTGHQGCQYPEEHP